MPSALRHCSTISLVALAAAGLAACNKAPAPGNAVASASPAPDVCGQLAPTQTPALPSAIGQNQTEVDCAAWGAFIALNWKADPANPGHPDPAAQWASFGTPGDMTPTVWESYLEASAVFGGGANGAPLKGMWQAKRPAKQLFRTSKFGDMDLTDITQAGSGDHWLTSQSGQITYYEVMMNQDEFEFITQDGFDLTTAAGQLKCATQPGKVISDSPPPYKPDSPKRGGFNMPVGSQPGWEDTDCAGNAKAFGAGVGAMEIKAAWAPLPADHSLDYRYKTAQAQIVDPTTRQMRSVTVGLVGLHIIRKRFPKMPWVWASFEQIDNSPDEAANGGFSAPVFPANANQKPSPGYMYFNPNCDPAKDPTYGCKHNAPPVVGTSPYSAPMQITRLRPVGATANGVTAQVWGMLPANSVFNYYRLIDVQWPQAPLGVPPGPGLRTPLTHGDPAPAGGTDPQQIVANTTLESFQQSSNACMDCHVFAPIAPLQPQLLKGRNGLRTLTKASAQASYASDYSFLFISETKR